MIHQVINANKILNILLTETSDCSRFVASSTTAESYHPRGWVEIIPVIYRLGRELHPYDKLSGRLDRQDKGWDHKFGEEPFALALHVKSALLGELFVSLNSLWLLSETVVVCHLSIDRFAMCWHMRCLVVSSHWSKMFKRGDNHS